MDTNDANGSLPKVFQALVFYRTLFGDCNVPEDFNVPRSSARWPSTCQGLNLGTHVKHLRNAHSKFHAEFEQNLEALGFVWVQNPSRVRCAHLVEKDNGTPLWTTSTRSFVELIETLTVYHSLYGNCVVPKSFVVPLQGGYWPAYGRGLLLCEAIHLLELHAYQLSPSQLIQVQSLGLLKNIPSWLNALAMVKMYKQLHGLADIPINFIVPPISPWKKAWHGTCLGIIAWKLWLYQCLLLPVQQEELKAIQFSFNTITSWKQVLAGAQTFMAKYDHVSIPHSFIIPNDDPQWPQEMWGMELGKYYAFFVIFQKCHQLSPTTREAWQKINSYQTASITDINLFRLKLLGIDKYREIYKDTNIPTNFVVPKQEPWPEALHGFGLGKVVENLRREVLNDAQIAALNDVGIVWNVDVHETWSDLFKVLTTWRREYPHVAINDCTVLHQNSMWPKHLWGIPLGQYLLQLEASVDFSRPYYREQLVNVGFDYSGRWENKLLALTTFKAFYGHLHVPKVFVVPQEKKEEADFNWPRETQRLPLGLIVEWIRQLRTEITPEKQHELDAIGFEWDIIDFDLVALGSVTYSKLHSQSIPPDFIVPRDNSWPNQLHDIPLGKWAAKHNEYIQTMEAVYASTLQRFLVHQNPTNDSSHSPQSRVFSIATVMLAIEQYRAIYKSVKIPLLFVVPRQISNSQWSPSAESLPLGFLLAWFELNFSKLRKIVKQCLIKKGYSFTLGEKELLEDLSEIDEEPEETMTEIISNGVDAKLHKSQHNYESQKLVANIDSINKPTPQALSIDKLGSDFNTSVSKEPISSDANATAKRLRHSERLVSHKNNVIDLTADDDIHINVQTLGKTKDSITTPQYVKDKEPPLKKPRKVDPDLFAVGAMVFQALHGHCSIPSQFFIPEHDKMWPETLWRYPLGEIAESVYTNRVSMPDRIIQQLKSMGFYTPRVASQSI